MKEANKGAFHSLDAFRFFAFLKVFIFHVPLYFAANELGKAWYSDHIRHGGGIGVSFFFTLSGFLITYILTAEKLKTGSIKFTRFLTRRGLRILPLYYFGVMLAVFLPYEFAEQIGFHMNGGGYDPDWRFSFTFLENYKSLIMDQSPKTTPLPVFWSLCIEIQFYLVWLLVIFFIKRKAIPYFLVIATVVSWFLRAYGNDFWQNENIVNNDLFSNMDYFAISGLLGYFVAVNRLKVSDFVMKIPKWIQFSYLLGVIFVILFLKLIFMHDLWWLNIFKFSIQAVIFTFLILLFIPAQSYFKISDENILTKLGKLSYGLYVYHIIWIHVIFTNYQLKLDNWNSYVIFVVITFVGTVMTAYLSNRFFEQPILRLREKWFRKN